MLFRSSERDKGNEPSVIESLEKEFQVLGYNTGELESEIDRLKVDVGYFINSGRREELPKNCRTAVHAVFQFNEPHGDRYAYVSKWLSDEMSQGQIPYVPHIVDLPAPTGTYKKALGIADNKIVVGRIGGYHTFDIPDVKSYIKSLVNKDDRFVFLFVGTEPFIDHPNVKFINEIFSPQKKSNFINTCDCMLHARLRGESFGLSVAEFLSLNKPVVSWFGGVDRNHLEMLKGSETLYNNNDDLDYILHNLKDFNQDWTKRVEEYKPNMVMNKFNEVFLK